MTEITYKRSERHIMKDHVVKAVDLTHNMLTLLPPLIVTTHLKEYDEQAHEIKTKRDESNKGRKQLLYYRPILVNGNQLHVAMKGLVGNVEKDVVKEPQCQQGHEKQKQHQERDREQKELERCLQQGKEQREQERRLQQKQKEQEQRLQQEQKEQEQSLQQEQKEQEQCLQLHQQQKQQWPQGQQIIDKSKASGTGMITLCT